VKAQNCKFRAACHDLGMLKPLVAVALLILGGCADSRVAGRQVAATTCASTVGYVGPCYDSTDRTDRTNRDDLADRTDRTNRDDLTDRTDRTNRDDVTDRTVWCVEPAMMIRAPAFMVFFDWDRSELSPQALDTIRQAAAAYKTKGGAQLTATGHTDRSGPETYNMALSLRRANAVKDALVGDGVAASDISVVGVGEAQPLVPTADGVREAQNRRVQIVLR
jgi:outer membrane protein OmpA-like peptidoglycan-associated protein